jgi:hypothetical protein
MIILAYFEEGPGTDAIKKLVSDVVLSAAQRIGVNENKIDKIAVAYPEHYGKAVHDLTGESFTQSQNYIGVGKTISRMDQGKLRHSIVFHASIVEAVLQAHIQTHSNNILDWKVEQQCMYFVIPHELGHCKDHEERMIASNKGAFNFCSGFELESIHQYYSDILIDEVCACIFADKYYSEEMINHRFTEESKTLAQSYDTLRENLHRYPGQGDLLHLATNASGWIWLYQTQLAKHIISSSYGLSGNFLLTPLVEIFQHCEEEHSFLLQSLDLILEKYPKIPQDAKEKLTQGWRGFARRAGFTFEAHQNGWYFYWK